MQYNSQFGHFAHSLSELGPSASGTEDASAANLISGDLATGEKQGYKFTLTDASTGSRTFFSDQSLVIRENYGREPATINSQEVGAAAVKPCGTAK